MKTFFNLIVLIVSIVIFSLISIVALIVQAIRKPIRKESLSDYLSVCAIAEDQRAGSYLYGTEDWTVSSYTYYLAKFKYNKHAKHFYKIIDLVLFLFDGSEHCKRAYEKEKKELHSGGAIRK